MKKWIWTFGVTVVAMIIALRASSWHGLARAAENAGDREVIFGVHPTLGAGEFTIECNCDHPGDVNEACHPNCSRVASADCLIRLRPVWPPYRCMNLPDHPLVYRAVLRKDCVKKEGSPPEEAAIGQHEYYSAPIKGEYGDK